MAGRVGDSLSGFAGLSVKIQSPGAPSGLAAVVDVGLGNNGTYQRGEGVCWLDAGFSHLGVAIE